jgi:DMSO reductase anchor subunit
MTTLMQAVSGALIYQLLNKSANAVALIIELLITSVALSVSAMHLGRPAYAWRALKMWRRSWISREVLLYSLFFAALAALASLSVAAVLPPSHLRAGIDCLPITHFLLSPLTLQIIGWAAAFFGVGGTICSAYIYLVPARPSWNMIHTPLDFLLTTAFLGWLFALFLHILSNSIAGAMHIVSISTDEMRSPVNAGLLFAAFWALNHVVRRVRLSFSPVFERRASASLLSTESLQAILFSSFALAALGAFFAFARMNVLAVQAGFAAILMTRYLFFVSVVPLNMALSFVRGGRH